MRLLAPFAFLVLALSATGGCSSATPEAALGSVTVGTYTLDIAREGDVPAAGVTTRFVMKSTAGGNPTSITGWVGLASAEGSVKALASYDAKDGDFDDDVTCPSPLPANSMFYFEAKTGDTSMNGSIAFK